MGHTKDEGRQGGCEAEEREGATHRAPLSNSGLSHSGSLTHRSEKTQPAVCNPGLPSTGSTKYVSKTPFSVCDWESVCVEGKQHCSTPFCVRHLSSLGVWYLQGSWNRSPSDTRGQLGSQKLYVHFQLHRGVGAPNPCVQGSTIYNSPGNGASGRGNSRGKGPEAGPSTQCLRNKGGQGGRSGMGWEVPGADGRVQDSGFVLCVITGVFEMGGLLLCTWKGSLGSWVQGECGGQG